MKLCALLSWYDEDAAWLAETVHSLARLGVDALVAVDGRYATFAGPVASDPKQRYALELAAGEAGIDCEVFTPEHPWPSEMEKRTFMFRMAESGRPDWYLVIDGDEVVVTDYDVKTPLSQTEANAAVVTLKEPTAAGEVKVFALRMFFRAIPGLRVHGQHHHYVTPDGTKLWGSYPVPPALDLRAVEVLHRTNLRPPERRKRALDYYAERDRDGLELDRCVRCQSPSTTSIPGNWREDGNGLTSVWLAVCDEHKLEVRERNDETLRGFGLDPQLVRVTFRPLEETFV